MERSQLIGAAVTAAGLVLWVLWILAARHKVDRQSALPDAGPQTIDLGPEPPAVVNVLFNHLAPTGDAVAATILDLAARKHLDIIQVSPTEHRIVPKHQPREGLLPYEVRMLDLVDTAAAGGADASPAEVAKALDPGSAVAWHTFASEVRADARGRGLITAPSVAYITAALPILLLTFLGAASATPWTYAPAAPLFLFMLLGGLGAIIAGHPAVLTDAGRAAAARWLGVRRTITDDGSFDELPAGAVAVWDRYLAYGAAMGLSGKAVHGLVVELRTHLSVADVRMGFRQARRARQAKLAAATPHDRRRMHLSRWKGWTVAGLVITAGVLALLGALGVITPRADPPDVYVVVPDVMGEHLDVAKRDLAAKGLHVVDAEPLSSSEDVGPDAQLTVVEVPMADDAVNAAEPVVVTVVRNDRASTFLPDASP